MSVLWIIWHYWTRSRVIKGTPTPHSRFPPYLLCPIDPRYSYSTTYPSFLINKSPLPVCNPVWFSAEHLRALCCSEPNQSRQMGLCFLVDEYSSAVTRPWKMVTAVGTRRHAARSASMASLELLVTRGFSRLWCIGRETADLIGGFDWKIESESTVPWLFQRNFSSAELQKETEGGVSYDAKWCW